MRKDGKIQGFTFFSSVLVPYTNKFSKLAMCMSVLLTWHTTFSFSFALHDYLQPLLHYFLLHILFEYHSRK